MTDAESGHETKPERPPGFGAYALANLAIVMPILAAILILVIIHYIIVLPNDCREDRALGDVTVVISSGPPTIGARRGNPFFCRRKEWADLVPEVTSPWS